MNSTPDEIKSNLSILDKITKAIPLYHGYKEKEIRRESDRILRNYLVDELNIIKSELKTSQTKFVEKNNLKFGNLLDDILTKIDTMAQKLRIAENGYSGFLDAVKIVESDLDKVYQVDSKMKDSIHELTLPVNQLSLDNSDDVIETYCDQILNEIKLIDTQFTERNRILGGVN